MSNSDLTPPRPMTMIRFSLLLLGVVLTVSVVGIPFAVPIFVYVAASALKNHADRKAFENRVREELILADRLKAARFF